MLAHLLGLWSVIVLRVSDSEKNCLIYFILFFLSDLVYQSDFVILRIWLISKEETQEMIEGLIYLALTGIRM